MAYDEQLANRVRELLAGERAVSEMRMFGGLAFLLSGNMSVAVSGRGGLLVRVADDAVERALASPHARPMVMRGREMRNWLHVDVAGLKTKRQLATWVERGVELARS